MTPDRPVAPDPAWPDEPGDRSTGSNGRFPVPFGVLDGIGLAGWTIVAQVITLGPLGALGFEGGNDVATLIVLISVQLFTFAGAAGWLAARGALSWRVLGPKRPQWKHVALGVGVGLVGFVGVNTILEVVNRVFGPFDVPDQAITESVSSGGALLVLSGVVTVVMAPLVEEFIFRGVLFQAGRSKLGLAAGFALTAVLWPLVHIEVAHPLAYLGLGLLALWLAGTFHRTGSLVVPLVGHATYNLVIVTILAL